MWCVKDDRIKMVRISAVYTAFLRENIEKKIPVEHSGKDHLPRPYIGILISIDEHKYVIPLSSPKIKHQKMRNSMDFQKINDGVYGAINFNNMFPVIDCDEIYRVIETAFEDTLPIEELQYRNLIRNQLTWLNIKKNKMTVLSKAEKLYNSYLNGKLNQRIKDRCCNFIELEKHYHEYLEKSV